MPGRSTLSFAYHEATATRQRIDSQGGKPGEGYPILAVSQCGRH